MRAARSGNDIKKTQSKTEWDRVLAHKEGDRIPYEPEDRRTIRMTRKRRGRGWNAPIRFAMAKWFGGEARAAESADEKAGIAAAVAGGRRAFQSRRGQGGRCEWIRLCARRSRRGP